MPFVTSELFGLNSLNVQKDIYVTTSAVAGGTLFDIENTFSFPFVLFHIMDRTSEPLSLLLKRIRNFQIEQPITFTLKEFENVSSTHRRSLGQ